MLDNFAQHSAAAKYCTMMAPNSTKHSANLPTTRCACTVQLLYNLCSKSTYRLSQNNVVPGMKKCSLLYTSTDGINAKKPLSKNRR